MALLFTEGFNYLGPAASDAERKWKTQALGQLAAGSGRREDNCWYFKSGGDLRTSAPTADPITTIIIGFAVNYDSLPGSVDQIFNFMGFSSYQAQLLINAGGTLEFRRGTSTVLDESSCAISPCTWYYIEGRVFCDNSGSWEFRVNGETWMSGSGDTQFSASAGFDEFWFEHNQSEITLIDDIYILDDSGTVNNDFLGDVYIDTIYPNAAGGSAAWAASPTAASPWLDVDESGSPDLDTSYISTSDVGDRHDFAFGDLSPSSASYFGVMAWACARKDDAASRAVALLQSDGATIEVGGSQYLTTSYLYYGTAFDEKPGGGAWTAAAINANLWGVELKA